MTRAEAKQFIADYFARFPTVKGYIDGVLERARDEGFVTTLLGRRRYLPDLRSRVYPLRAAAERMAINAPAQGSAADLIKLAMVKLDQRFDEQGTPRAPRAPSARRIDLRRADPTRSTPCAQHVKDAMENAMPLARAARRRFQGRPDLGRGRGDGLVPELPEVETIARDLRTARCAAGASSGVRVA